MQSAGRAIPSQRHSTPVLGPRAQVPQLPERLCAEVPGVTGDRFAKGARGVSRAVPDRVLLHVPAMHRHDTAVRPPLGAGVLALRLARGFLATAPAARARPPVLQDYSACKMMRGIPPSRTLRDSAY
eukprot:3222916-Prymnesium_polylepis.2